MSIPAIEFEHQHSAHCESGVISSLLRHSGLEISEAMAFGISGAYTFAYIPLLKIGGMPLIAYRMPPKHIITRLTSRLGITLEQQTFKNQQAGATALDQLLNSGQPVGMQTSVFWLPYFPEEMRFHFNAHNLVAFGKDDGGYHISDPTIERPVICDEPSLLRARFVKGMLRPKGLLYFPKNVPHSVDFRRPLLKAIQGTTKMMLKTPVPIIGIKGVRTLAKKIAKLEQSHSDNARKNKLFIGHVVRMQEEIGTGGAGFRFLYASFLQEAAALTELALLSEVAEDLTAAGDEWRSFALDAAMMCKGRKELDYSALSKQLLICADNETEVFNRLRDIKA